MNKIKYDVEPDAIGLVFPNHKKEEVKKIYEDFYYHSYDKFKSSKELKKLPEKEVLSYILEKTYHERLDFLDLLGVDKNFPKEYLSAVVLATPPFQKEEILKDMSEQFITYLWKKEIPVAQHLEVTYDNNTTRELEMMAVRHSE